VTLIIETSMPIMKAETNNMKRLALFMLSVFSFLLQTALPVPLPPEEGITIQHLPGWKVQFHFCDSVVATSTSGQLTVNVFRGNLHSYGYTDTLTMNATLTVSGQ